MENQLHILLKKRRARMKSKGVLTWMKRDWPLYLMLLPPFLWFIVFRIWPMFGMVLAFQDFRIIGPNQWVGFTHFELLFRSPAFLQVLGNTIVISLMKIIFFLPIPVILSLLIHEIRSVKYRKYVQSVIYLPHFLSWVVIAGIWIGLLGPSGAVNSILGFFQIPTVNFMTDTGTIRWVLVFSDIWRSAGWDSIIYLAAIMRISPALYEAASIDGANRLQQMRYITFPELKNTIMTVFILNLGFFMNAGFDQVFNFMNDSVISSIDILDTFVFRVGLVQAQFSFATAASLFKGAIGMVLILSTHFIAKKISGKGIW